MSAGEAEPAFSVHYGDERFDDFYEFLTKSVPSMERNARVGKNA
jgi:hypothetical protein